MKEGLANAQILEKKQGVRMEVTTDYNGVGKIQYLAAQEGIDTLDSQYTDKALSAAMNVVGKDFGAKKIFLPQVMLSAEAMRVSRLKVSCMSICVTMASILFSLTRTMSISQLSLRVLPCRSHDTLTDSSRTLELEEWEAILDLFQLVFNLLLGDTASRDLV